MKRNFQMCYVDKIYKCAKQLLFILLIINFNPNSLFSQEIFVDSRNDFVYSFIDEMASLKLIDNNSAIKPLSRKQIYNFLVEVIEKQSELNDRQKKELYFLLESYKYDFINSQDPYSFINSKSIKFNKLTKFNKPLNFYSYKDSLIRFTINPILGYEYFGNAISTVYHRWNGAEAYGTIGKHLGFYASLRDNHESEVLAMDSFLTQRIGASYKSWDLGKNRTSGADYSQIFAGITYSWNWGAMGVRYDHFQWGTNINGSNIFSGRTPAFAQIFLKVKPIKWFELNYIHGWLNSNVIDSLATYSIPPNFNYTSREVYKQKYLAANFLTFQPFQKLYFSVGNSIIYSDVGIHPAYLIPIMFYNSADQDIGNNNNFAGQNSQFYFDLSSRQIKKLHLYSSLFVDELSFSRMWDKTQQSNYISLKSGFSYSNILNSNLSLFFEYTRTNPQVYKHVIPTTTFASNDYNLGHYLGDNAEDIFLMLTFKPVSKLLLKLSYNKIRKGKEYDLISGSSRWGLPFIDSTCYSQSSFLFEAKYIIYSNLSLKYNLTYSNSTGNTTRYSARLYDGKVLTNSFAINWGI